MTGTAYAEKTTLAVGDNAPAFVLKTLNPKESGVNVVALRRWVGSKAKKDRKRGVVLSFSASYCLPCKKELAELKLRHKELKAAGVELVVVVIDREAEGISAMKKLTLEELEIKFPVVLDRFGIVARRYSVDKLPMLTIVGEQGQVKWSHVGYDEKTVGVLMSQLGLGPKS